MSYLFVVCCCAFPDLRLKSSSARWGGDGRRVTEERGEEGVFKGGRGGVVRVRYFTNSKGIKGINSNGVITASDQNKVFTVKAQGKPGGPRDIEEVLGIKRGRGNNYVEFDAKPEEFQTIKNVRTGTAETVFEGDVDLSGRNATFHKNR